MDKNQDTIVTYYCVTGHEVRTPDLDSQTEVRSLDQGAVIRLCREHGAPIGGVANPGAPDALSKLSAGG